MFDWVIPFLVVLTVLVFVHELGHYLVARRCGVRVETFSIGFGPELFGWTDRHGTRWKFSAVPLGGYVKMFGEMDFTDEDERPALSEEERRVSFHHKSLKQKSAIVAAGPAANFLFAVVALLAVFTIVGEPAPLAVVGSVQPGSAAEQAGLTVGDEIKAIDDEPVAWFEDIRRLVSQQPGVPLQFAIERAGVPLELTATPLAKTTGDGKTVGLLGVTPDLKRVGYHPAVAAGGNRRRFRADVRSDRADPVQSRRNHHRRPQRQRTRRPDPDRPDLGRDRQGRADQPDLLHGGPVGEPRADQPLPGADAGWRPPDVLRNRGDPRQTDDHRVLDHFRFGVAVVLLLMVFATWNDIVNLKVIEFYQTTRQLITKRHGIEALPLVHAVVDDARDCRVGEGRGSAAVAAAGNRSRLVALVLCLMFTLVGTATAGNTIREIDDIVGVQRTEASTVKSICWCNRATLSTMRASTVR